MRQAAGIGDQGRMPDPKCSEDPQILRLGGCAAFAQDDRTVGGGVRQAGNRPLPDRSKFLTVSAN